MSIFFFIISIISDRLRADGKIDVFNANRQSFPDGKPSNITGIAFNPDPSEPGKYKVQFPNSGPPGDCKYSFCLPDLNQERARDSSEKARDGQKSVTHDF